MFVVSPHILSFTQSLSYPLADQVKWYVQTSVYLYGQLHALYAILHKYTLEGQEIHRMIERERVGRREMNYTSIHERERRYIE